MNAERRIGYTRQVRTTGNKWSPEQIAAVMSRARQAGLLRERDGRITARVSVDLIRRAKAMTGLTSDAQLLQFALALIALDDDFASTFRRLKGTVDPEIELGY